MTLSQNWLAFGSTIAVGLSVPTAVHANDLVLDPEQNEPSVPENVASQLEFETEWSNTFSFPIGREYLAADRCCDTPNGKFSPANMSQALRSTPIPPHLPPTPSAAFDTIHTDNRLRPTANLEADLEADLGNAISDTPPPPPAQLHSRQNRPAVPLQIDDGNAENSALDEAVTPPTALPRQPETLTALTATRKTAADLIQPSHLYSSPSTSSPPLAPSAASAPAADSPIAQDLPAPPPSFTPRVGVGYNGAGHEGNAAFGRLEGFIPLRQNPGGDLTFLEGRVLLDNDANLGSNAIIGHRAYNKQDNRVYGGYIGYDTRDTGHKFFQQIGLGFESLGETWDIRTNFYIPIGDTSQQVDVEIFDTGLLVTDLRFSDHFLLFDTFRERSERRVREAAVFSFDLEAGGRIAKFGDRGDLWLYGGPYYYSPPGGRDVLGWRTRLVARPSRHLKLSLGAQTDSLLGTNLLFQIGASFPSHRPKRNTNPEQTVMARLGDFVERNPSIVIDQQVSESFFQEILAIPARNPATGDPWFFNHVTLGVSGGDGTFENPFGIVQSALDNTRSDGNDIVYVAFGTNPGIPPFTIPDKVQVLSRGPVQTIPVITTLQSERQPLRTVTISSPLQLPFSDSGNFPLIEGAQSGAAVMMGNDSVLSGFTINPTSGSVGVLARNVQNVDIRENRITTTGDDAAGIRLQNASGFAFITNNQIQTAGNTTNNMSDNANFLTNGAHGIEIDLTNTTLDTARVSGNTISTAGTYAAGILNNVRDGGTLSESTISGNTVSTQGERGYGISSQLRNSGGGSARIGSLSISGNTASTQGAYADAIDLEAGNATRVGSVSISGNTASAQGDEAEAIDVELEDAHASSLSIADNTASTQGRRAEGIHVEIDDEGGGASLGTLSITGNRVSTQGNGAYGIDVELDNDGGGAIIGSATISGNTVSTEGNGARGIYTGIVTEDGGGGIIGSATISGNTVSTQGNETEGIVTIVVADDGGSARIGSATISGNTVSTQGNRANGIYTFVLGDDGGSGSITSATISGNTVSTQGNGAYGIYTFVVADDVGGSTSIGSATISGNTVSTQGNGAPGIYTHILADDGGSTSIDSVTISGNRVSTQGNGAYGIITRVAAVSGSSTNIVSATISGNTVSTQGNFSYGIFTFVGAFGGGSSTNVSAATISGNTVSTQGNGAYGLFTLVRSGGGAPSFCATFSGNTATTEQVTASPFLFVNLGGTFQIADTAATFPTTQATNTANANGGAMPFAFAPAVGAFTQVTSCP